MSPLLLVHTAATLALVGLLWFVQVVHYPLFAQVGRSEFAAYHRRHMRRTGRVVAPLMLAEASAAVMLWLRPGALPVAALRLGVLLLAVCWISTFLLQVPRHRRLGSGFDETAQRELVATNWIRTGAWTGRAGVALWLLAAAA